MSNAAEDKMRGALWRALPTSGYLDQPLRTRERAALDAARAALRKIVQADGWETAHVLSKNALERIAIILGERK